MENYEYPQVDEMIDDTYEEVEEEEETKGPFDGLLNYFKEALAKEDAKGFAEVYKKSTENFFALMDKYYKDDGLSFTPIDVEYGDGYFIFVHGTNTVVSFHLKEAPGWLFGIWWNPIEKNPDRIKGEPAEYDNERIHCSFFAQYEEEIDKFKPSNSTFVAEFDWWLDEGAGNYYAFFRGQEVVSLILTEPILAWYRDCMGIDFNCCYITREEAQDAFNECQLRKNQCKLIDMENKQKMLDCLTTIFKPVIDEGNAFIHDQGDYVSPRYELFIRNVWKDDLGQEDSKDGCYDLFDFGADWPDKAEDKALWERTIAECKARADEIKHYWFNPVSRCVIIASSEKFYRIKKSDEENKED